MRKEKSVSAGHRNQHARRMRYPEVRIADLFRAPIYEAGIGFELFSFRYLYFCALARLD